METATRIGEARVQYTQIFEQLSGDSRKTKIVATMGPSCSDPAMLVKMLDLGMNAVKFNFAKGGRDVQQEYLENLKEALTQRPSANCGLIMETVGLQF